MSKPRHLRVWNTLTLVLLIPLAISAAQVTFAAANTSYFRNILWQVAGDPETANGSLRADAHGVVSIYSDGSDSDRRTIEDQWQLTRAVNYPTFDLFNIQSCEGGNAGAAMQFSSERLSGPDSLGLVTVNVDNYTHAWASVQEGGYASASATVAFRLNSGIQSGENLAGQKNTLRLDWSNLGQVGKRLDAPTPSGYGWSHAVIGYDVAMEIYDLEAGTTIVERLFSMHSEGRVSRSGDGEALAAAAWYCYFDNFLYLSTQTQGSSWVSISGVADSLWLEDPLGSFGATLSNSGGFHPSGSWTGLNWARSAGYASLTANQIAPYMILDYTIPEHLIDPDHHYEQVLVVQPHVDNQGNLAVPEPSGLSLVGIPALILLNRRGKIARR